MTAQRGLGVCPRSARALIAELGLEIRSFVPGWQFHPPTPPSPITASGREVRRGAEKEVTQRGKHPKTQRESRDWESRGADPVHFRNGLERAATSGMYLSLESLESQLFHSTQVTLPLGMGE